jgi:hypothetical protein
MDTDVIADTSAVRMSPESLPEDIYRILDDDTDHRVSEDNVEWAGEVFKNLLRSRLAKRDSSGDVLRFSSLGKKDRQLWYAKHKPETAEKLHGQVKFKFLYGDILEVLLLFLAKESGHSVEDAQYEVEQDGVKGHIDAIIDGVLVDVKSASSYSYEKFKSGSYVFDDPFGYVSQLSGYANCLKALGKLEDTRAGFLVADKVNGRICYAGLDEEYILGNPPGPRIAKLRDVLANPTPPSRCYPDEPEGKSGNRKLGVGCSYCAFKEECWDDRNGGKGLRKFFYAKGPVWLTQVKKEPNVPEAS